MVRAIQLAVVCVGVVTAGPSVASAAPILGTAELSNFIQNGTITNTSASLTLDEVIFSLGSAEDNLATWDNASAGGVKSDFLSNPQYFQTVTWSGLSVAPGGTFNFGTLDIDLIVTLSPLNVVGSPLGGPETLRNGFIQVHFTNGSTASAELVEQGWANSQNLNLEEATAVPEPSSLALLGIGVMGYFGYGWRRKRRRHLVPFKKV